MTTKKDSKSFTLDLTKNWLTSKQKELKLFEKGKKRITTHYFDRKEKTIRDNKFDKN